MVFCINIIIANLKSFIKKTNVSVNYINYINGNNPLFPKFSKFSFI